MTKDIIRQLNELELAISRTRQLADGFTSRVEKETARLDIISVKLTGLQGLLNQAGSVVGEIHTNLEEVR